MVSGTGEYVTEVMRIAGGKVAIKSGAEGVFAGIVPGLGLGICIKNEDGTGRGNEAAMSHVLMGLGVLNAEQRAQLADRLNPVLKNRAGTKIGRIRAAAEAGF